MPLQWIPAVSEGRAVWCTGVGSDNLAQFPFSQLLGEGIKWTIEHFL